jgi:HlyD family secretion protein
LVYKRALLQQAEKQKQSVREAWKVALEEVEVTKKDDQKYKADVEYNRQRVSRISALVRQRAQDVQVEQEATKQLESARAALAANGARTARQEARVRAAIADYELAEQRIKVAQADMQKLMETIAFATIKAPFDAVITRRWVDPGAIIRDPGTTLFTLMQMERVRVLIDVPQRDVPQLNSREQNPNPDGRGDAVTVIIPALAEEKNLGKFEGTITRVSRSLDPVTRTMRAEIEMPNPGLQLRPGMFGTASVLVEDRSNVLTVPASALVRRGEGMVEVYCVADAVATGEGDERRGILVRKAVVLGIDDGKEVEIREGLKGDELVVSRSTGIMRADDPVIAVTERDSVATKNE